MINKKTNMIGKIQELAKISNSKIIICSILSIVSGLSGFAFIALINKLIEESILGNRIHSNYHYYEYGFVAILILFFFSKRILSEMIIILSQDLYWNIRKNIITSVLSAPPDLIKKKRKDIYSTITSDVGSIVNGSLLIIDFISSIIIVLACCIYMAFLSLKVFGVSFLIIIFGVVLYIFRMKSSNEQFNQSRNLEKDFISYFDAILYGIKEINLNPKIGDKINLKIKHIGDNATRNDKGAFIGYLNTQIISQSLFYFLIIFILFYVVKLLHVRVEVSISFVFVLLYISGPISNIMAIFPMMNKTIISLERIINLKQELKVDEDMIVSTEKKEVKIHFDKLEYRKIKFSYEDNKFSIGPLDFIIAKGNIIFIYGGNGNGKTTLLNILLNIYKIDAGQIILNEQLLDLKEFSNFNNLFSPVFSDFYLFDEFYGIDIIDIQQANEYLKMFEVDDKIIIENNKFSTVDLSTGQRKRLALINALLENKPIIVLDEWAADQDPIFRNKFYKEIIPFIISKGFTIVAITHDDKYYKCADKLFKMEYGILIETNEFSLN